MKLSIQQTLALTTAMINGNQQRVRVEYFLDYLKQEPRDIIARFDNGYTIRIGAKGNVTLIRVAGQMAKDSTA